MRQDTYELLEDCQTRIYNALRKNTRVDKEQAYTYAVSYVYAMEAELDMKWEELKRLGYYVYKGPLENMNDVSLDINLHFCIDVINKRMRLHFASPISPSAVQTVFFSPVPLEQSTILYEEKGTGGSERRLRVADFLSVLNYAKKFAEANLDANFDRYNGGLIAVRTVDLAINHKPVDKPLNKTLHLVNDIFTECAKAFHQDKEAKRTASGISLLVDLAIDFLVRS